MALSIIAPLAQAAALERRPAEIVVLNSGKRSVDGLYKLLQTDVQGKPAYERVGSKNKPRFLFFKKRWTIGGSLGLQRSGVLTLSGSSWQRYKRTADKPTAVPCPSMQVLDAATAPPAKKRRKRRGHCDLLQLPGTATAAIFEGLGIRARFLLGAASKAARGYVLDTPALWHNVHLDAPALNDFLAQTTHARKHDISWLDPPQHPMRSVRRLNVSVDEPPPYHGHACHFRWYHLLTLLRSFFKAAAHVRVTGDVRNTRMRDLLLFIIPSVLPAGQARRLPAFAVAATRFSVTRDDADPGVGMPRAQALQLLEQGRFVDAFLPGHERFSRADAFSMSLGEDLAQFCVRMRSSLQPAPPPQVRKPRVRII